MELIQTRRVEHLVNNVCELEAMLIRMVRSLAALC